MIQSSPDGNDTSRIGTQYCGVGTKGNLTAPCREPLNWLNSHPVPRRIADHGVESAMELVAFPLRPHARKRHLPIEEAFVVEDLPRFVEQPSKPLTVLCFR